MYCLRDGVEIVDMLSGWHHLYFLNQTIFKRIAPISYNFINVFISLKRYKIAGKNKYKRGEFNGKSGSC